MKTILIAGGTGFVGKTLIEKLGELGYKINVLVRSLENHSQSHHIKYFFWNIDKQYIDENAFENVTTIINLTGANIGAKRWTNQRKTEIVTSRVDAISILYKYVVERNITLDQFISASAVGFYGAITKYIILEESALANNDFLSEVCRKWEAAAQQFNALGVKVIILRKGVVIGSGGMYGKLAPLAKFGLNTAVGNGKQYLPWVALEDVINIYIHFLQHYQLSGIYNVVASQHITLNDFSSALVASFKKKKILPNVPKFLLQFALGEMSDMLLEGTRVSNSKLIESGYVFKYNEIDKILNNLSRR
jgi:uncharacterized protein (TIGR01777 family)